MTATPLPSPRPHLPRWAGWATLAALLVIGAGFAVRALLGGGQALLTTGEPVPASGSVASTTDAQITALQKKIEARADNVENYLALSSAYLQKVRETGDPSLYGRADAALKKAAAIAPDSGDLFAAQATLLLSRHDFEGALVLAKKALATDPERARYYGVVADAEIELGQYDSALANLQEMVNRKPDFAAFSRVAYMRELYGDLEGAIFAFEAALDSSSENPENVAWAHVQSGNLSFALGNLREADQQYALALVRFPGYAVALAAQGRLAASNGDYAIAETLLKSAIERMPLAEYAITLGDVYAKQGKAVEARKQYDLVLAIDKLQSQNGVNTDLEISLFLSDHGIDNAGSLERARQAYARRPSVHAAEALAWALHRDGKDSEAMRYATESLRLGSRDSLKLFHAGIIAKANGRSNEAFTYLEEALRLNPNFSLLHTAEARAALEEVRPK